MNSNSIKGKQIVNIIHFQRRWSTPLFTNDLDTFPCAEHQMNLVEAFGFPVTYLLDYGAFTDNRFKEKLKNCHNYELGAWFEIIRPLTDKAGIEWHGKDIIWDIDANVYMSAGYTLEERIRLVDVFMEDFKSNFDIYPSTVGAWLIDAYTLNYMHEKYGVKASCFCRDQWGTDGISFWGGYYGHGYYPSKYNSFCPATTKENQIDVPIFRLLGSCPIEQYDNGMSVNDGPSECMGVVTLEPSYKDKKVGGGGVPNWVDWFLEESFRPDTLSFNYTHVGQENTFGWTNQVSGTAYQFTQLKQLVAEGKVELQTLGQTAELYRQTYLQTCATSITALDDWKHTGKQSFWYNCKNYRMNFYKENGVFWIRDIHLFRETYLERYRETPLADRNLLFDNLPVIDGNRWSGSGVRAGLYPEIVANDGSFVALKGESNVEYDEPNEKITVTDGDTIFTILLTERDITFSCNKEFRLVFKTSNQIELFNIEGNRFLRKHNGFEYSFALEKGTSVDDSDLELLSNEKEIKIKCVEDI